VVARSNRFVQMTRDIAEYVARKFKDTGKFCKGMVELYLPELDEPDKLDQTAMPINIKSWEMDLKEHRKKVEARKTNSDLVYALILGQCSQAMRNRLDMHKSWSLVDKAMDLIGLLEMLQQCMGEGDISIPFRPRWRLRKNCLPSIKLGT